MSAFVRDQSKGKGTLATKKRAEEKELIINLKRLSKEMNN